MKKILGAAAALSLLAFGNGALADEPMQLTDSQMDHVTAGDASAFADAEAFALGGPLSIIVTETGTLALVEVIGAAQFGNTVSPVVASLSVAESFSTNSGSCCD
jgi:hypothetical protein